jgi:hypothetical protein
MKGAGLTMKILKTEDLSNNKLFYESLTKINLLTFCDLIQNNNCLKTFENTTITVKLFQDFAFISLTYFIFQKTVSAPMASCMHNGNNETKIGLSHSVTITFSDINGNEIQITNSSQVIDIWIPRDINGPKVSPQ